MILKYREGECQLKPPEVAVSERGVHGDDLPVGILRHRPHGRRRPPQVGVLRLLGVGERLVGALVVVGVVAVAGRDEDAADPEHDAPNGVLPAVPGLIDRTSIENVVKYVWSIQSVNPAVQNVGPVGWCHVVKLRRILP